MITYADKGIPKNLWMPEPIWRNVLRYTSLPCADVIFQRSDSSVLFGFRIIDPYRNKWALPGGRILRGESLKQMARRIAKEYGLDFDELYLNGVFPVNFRRRSDVTISLVARKLRGEALPDGKEFSELIWSNKIPKGIGLNYRKMLSRWARVCESKDSLEIANIP